MDYLRSGFPILADLIRFWPIFGGECDNKLATSPAILFSHFMSRLKITVRRSRVHGRWRWMVRWHEGSRVKRSFFGSQREAEAVALRKRGEALTIDAQFLSLPAAQKDSLWLAHKLASERGLDLLSVVQGFKVSTGATMGSGAVLAEMLAAKLSVQRDRLYVRSLKSVVGAFILGRESRPMDVWSHADVEAFLASKSPSYRATLRSRLATWFKFAVRRGFRLDNPCDRLESVKVVKLPPQIFTPEQARSCLKFLKSDGQHRRGAHSGLAWFLLSAYAGLRPEEAMQVIPQKHLHLKAERPHIEVSADICKTGQWRIVYPPPAVVRALRWALKHGSKLPMPRKRKQRLQRQLRAVLALDRWPKDVTRHSASSYWLAMSNDQKHVAEMLGHSERMARSTYKKPVEKKTAEEFYAALNLLYRRERKERKIN